MKCAVNGDILNVSDIAELATASAISFQSELNAALADGVRQIDIDLSQTAFVDCGGLGALATLRKKTCGTNGNLRIRLLNPTQPIRRMVALMKMDRLFPVEECATLSRAA
jgi:anti-anti-sigma factor